LKSAKAINKRAAKFALIFGLSILFMTSVLVFWSATGFRESSLWREHSDVVIGKMREAHIALEMAEASQRGFVITQQSSFLETYQDSVKAVLARFNDLDQLISDNPSQQAVLAEFMPLLQKKISVLESVVKLVQDEKISEGVAIISSGEGQVLMLKLREILQNFESEEVRLYRIRALKADQDFKNATWTVVLGLAISFGLFLMSTKLLNDEIRWRSELEKSLSEATAKAQENSNLKSRFLANISHEIRTPLNGIIGMSTLLQRSALDATQSRFVETIKVSSNSLLALINQVLDISKIESGKLQLEDVHFELRSLLSSTLSIVEYTAKAKGLALRLDIEKSAPDFYVSDPLRIRQVLLNLLYNGIKFSDDGEVTLKVFVASTIESTAQVQFEVIDQGIGIDDETKSRLFQSFSQGDESTSRKYGGTGLGLAISKQIVEMMGGWIRAESLLGVGSKFIFQIPLKLAKFEEMPALRLSDELNSKRISGRILIVEDNVTNQQVAAEMLQLFGCSFVIVPNGVEALQALNSDPTFDLVLMDGQMPLMDGYEATVRIRAGEAGMRSRSIPIIATTANAIKGDNEKCLQAGMNDYISKPISFDDLASKVEEWLQRGKHILHPEALRRIDELSKKAKKNILKSLTQVFIEDAKLSLVDLRARFERKDHDGLVKQAHKLKSSCANIGALQMRDICERIERLAPDDDLNTVQPLLHLLEAHYEKVIAELEKLGEDRGV
jgi:signal transduction histidine kinase/DNA-binding response OmpR family regulator